jgi:hypothetical protein
VLDQRATYLHLAACVRYYGEIDLDRNGITGNTKTWLSRIQWIY